MKYRWIFLSLLMVLVPLAILALGVAIIVTPDVVTTTVVPEVITPATTTVTHSQTNGWFMLLIGGSVLFLSVLGVNDIFTNQNNR